MRSIGELMKELGFNPGSSEESQKAFIKNLVKAAAEVSPAPTPIHVGAPKPKLSAEDLASVPYVGSAKAAAVKKAAAATVVASSKDQAAQMEFDFGDIKKSS